MTWTRLQPFIASYLVRTVHLLEGEGEILLFLSPFLLFQVSSPDIGIFFFPPRRRGGRSKRISRRQEAGLSRGSYLTFVPVHAESYSRRVSLGQLISMCRGGTY